MSSLHSTVYSKAFVCVRECVNVSVCWCVLEFQVMPPWQEVSGDSRDQGWLIWPMKRMVPENTGEKHHTSLACFCKQGQILSSVLASIWIYSCFGSTASSDEKLNSVNVFKILPQNSVIHTCWVVSDEEEERSVHCHPGWRGTSQQDGS